MINPSFSPRRYVKSIQPYLILSMILFLLSLFMGYAYGVFIDQNISSLLDEMGGLFDFIHQASAAQMFLIIFFNNTLKGLMVIMLGIGLGLVPVIFIVFNGFLVGMAVYFGAQTRGMTYVAMAILPHGVLEVPVILLSTAMGLRLGRMAIRGIQGDKVDLRAELTGAFKMFVYVVLPLLLLAAIIEAYLTVMLVQ